MFITQKHLSRRTLLRGVGTSLALPLLDAMIPAMKAQSLTAAAPVRRMGFIYYPHGMVRERWTPISQGSGLKMSEALAPLEPHKNKVLVLSGLTSSPDRTKVDFHDRALASWLTGCEPHPGPGRNVGISVDQLIAQKLGKDTKFASLETTGQEGSGGIVYKNATTPLPFESNPRTVFERLFGDSGQVDGAAAKRQQMADRSLLDGVMERLSALKGRLGAADRNKLDEYVDSIRDVEHRIQLTLERPAPDLPGVTRPAGIPSKWSEHVKLMYDLNVLALQSDLTRVFTFMYNRESSYMTFPEVGVTMQHHEISHHNYQPDKLDALTKINVLQSELFAYFLTKMEAVKEANGSLLDQSVVMFGSDLSNPTVHSQRNLPILLAGGAAAGIAGGRFIDYGGDETPLTNLYVALLEKVGLPTEKFGDSTGKIDRLEA